jgi:hypothetical protein
MRGGDISNEVPPRILVALDCILKRETVVTKVLGIGVPKTQTTYSRLSLAMFWRFAEKFGYTLELVGFGISQTEMDNILEDLHNLGTNPFSYATSYYVVADLVAELPYRPEVRNVIDVPDRALRYGHWYLDVEALNNGSR